MNRFIVKKIAVFVFSLVFVLASVALLPAADVLIRDIADDSRLRASKADWLTESPARVLAKPRSVHTLNGGGRVQVRVEEGRTEFMVVFARELMVGRVGERPVATGQFPQHSQGSWMLTRRRDTGEPIRIGIYLRSDPNIFVQLRPSGNNRSFLDVVLYNAFVVRSVLLPVSFERLFTMPIAEVINLAGSRFPRRYFEPNPADYAAQRQFIANVRERLPELSFADDGAINQYGQFVYIATGLPQQGRPGLNCSGFAKWLIDGILRPRTGERLTIPPLKAPFGDRGSSFTEAFEELRDPFFGLDWIRNLASTAGTTLLSPAFGTLEEIEVRTDSFSQIISRQGAASTVISFPGFHPNSGFGLEGLQPLLYKLAINEPGRFFLAAVNDETRAATTLENLRGLPVMRQYFHVAAFVPYFNEYGVFRVAVFESAAETSLSGFINRYRSRHGPGVNVALVRVPLETAFDP